MKLRQPAPTPASTDRGVTSSNGRSLAITYEGNPDKGSDFADALVRAGHRLVDGPGDVTLTHVEAPVGHYGRLLDLNDQVVIYPHGPGAVHFADGRWGPHPRVVANFVVGEGPAEIMRGFGYPHELVVVGWPYGGLGPFRPAQGKRLLFAPAHPRGYGYASRRVRLANRRAFEAALSTGYDVRVRLVGTPRQNGLYRAEGVAFSSVDYGGTTAGLASMPTAPALDADLDEADVVVTTGTVLYRSLARGLPTVGYGQMLWPEDWVHPEQRMASRRWPSYVGSTRFPLDLFGDDPARVIDRACATDDDVADWRRRFVGEPFDPSHFVDEFERVVR